MPWITKRVIRCARHVPNPLFVFWRPISTAKGCSLHTKQALNYNLIDFRARNFPYRVYKKKRVSTVEGYSQSWYCMRKITIHTHWLRQHSDRSLESTTYPWIILIIEQRKSKQETDRMGATVWSNRIHRSMRWKYSAKIFRCEYPQFHSEHEREEPGKRTRRTLSHPWRLKWRRFSLDVILLNWIERAIKQSDT